MIHLPWLDPYDDRQPFPPPESALRDPDGLLAAGGSLAPERLLGAYRQGIFPWYSPGQPILWWSPDPRMVLFPAALKVSRSLRKTLKKGCFWITMDTMFETVMRKAAEPREDQAGTWITPEMIRAYLRLHRLGWAHSVETWRDGELVGGLYGVAIGRVFYGESMFSRVSDASKAALVALAAQLLDWEFALIDCQMRTAHLASLGARELSRDEFLACLRRFCPLPGRLGPWRLDPRYQTGLPAAFAPRPEG